MIRYALVVVLATAIVGLAVPATEQVATARGEQAMRAEIASVGSAAESLAEHEPAVEGPGPRRIVTVEMHEHSPLLAEPARLSFERVGDQTRVTYRVESGVTQTRFLPVPIRHANGGPVTGERWEGTVRLALRLTVEDGQRVVTAEPYS